MRFTLSSVIATGKRRVLGRRDNSRLQKQKNVRLYIRLRFTLSSVTVVGKRRVLGRRVNSRSHRLCSTRGGCVGFCARCYTFSPGTASSIVTFPLPADSVPVSSRRLGGERDRGLGCRAASDRLRVGSRKEALNIPQPILRQPLPQNHNFFSKQRFLSAKNDKGCCYKKLILTTFLACKRRSFEDVGAKRNTVFQEIRPEADYKTGNFVLKSWGLLPPPTKVHGVFLIQSVEFSTRLL